MRKSEIITAFCERIETASILPAVYANTEESIAVMAADSYLEVTFPTARREDTSLRGGTLLREIGSVQVTVVVPVKTSLIAANDYAEDVAELFNKGVALTTSDAIITINQAPSIPGGFEADEQWREPIIISYLAVQN